MENNGKKQFKKIIHEIIGKQVEIDQAASYLTNMLIKNIKKTPLNKNETIDIPIGVIPNEEFKQKTKINKILGLCTISNSSSNKTSGKFLSKKTKLVNKKFYNISFEIFLKSDFKNIDNLKPKIESVIAHELNHAYVYIKKLLTQNPQKTNALNSINKRLNIAFYDTPALKEFTKMFYLNLPEEIQARVQETASILKYIEKYNYNDSIKQLYQYQPINDAIKMINYSPENLEILDKEILRSFVNSFNDKLTHNNKEYKIISNPDKFFKYWIKFINQNGMKLYKKIIKLIGNEFNINENDTIYKLDNELLNDISQF